MKKKRTLRMPPNKEETSEDKQISWMPPNKEAAFSLMDQCESAFLTAQYLGRVDGHGEVIRAIVPVHVANYLLEAFARLKHGVEPMQALGLTRPRGRSPDKDRNDMYAVRRDQIEKSRGIDRQQADKEIIKAIPLEEKAARNALKAGDAFAQFVSDVEKRLGPAVASDLIESKKKAVKKADLMKRGLKGK